MKYTKLAFCSFIMRLFFYLLLLIGVILVLYLSWLPQPKLGLLWLIPSWLAKWIDSREYNTIRTSVPFVFLGLLIGIRLYVSGQPWYWLLIAWFGLIAIVIIAETGQLFLPNRSFDWYDIAWGTSGAMLGLAIAFTCATFVKLLIQRHIEFKIRV